MRARCSHRREVKPLSDGDTIYRETTTVGLVRHIKDGDREWSVKVTLLGKEQGGIVAPSVLEAGDRAKHSTG